MAFLSQEWLSACTTGDTAGRRLFPVEAALVALE
jgi:hypothetical protein